MAPKHNFDTGGKAPKYDFSSMRQVDLEALLVATPEGRRLDELIAKLKVDAGLETEIRGIVAQALQAGVLIARVAL